MRTEQIMNSKEFLAHSFQLISTSFHCLLFHFTQYNLEVCIISNGMLCGTIKINIFFSLFCCCSCRYYCLFVKLSNKYFAMWWSLKECQNEMTCTLLRRAIKHPIGLMDRGNWNLLYSRCVAIFCLMLFSKSSLVYISVK